jgi:hypothetical protein
LRSEQQPVGSDNVSAFKITDEQVITKRVEFIYVQTPLVGRFQSFIEFYVKDLKPEPLSPFDFARLRGDLHFEVCHSGKS